MSITDAFDTFVKQKQNSCCHMMQDRIQMSNGTFCGNCSIEVE